MKCQSHTFLPLVLLVIIISTLIQGCQKENHLPWPLSELPKATQKGANTFGCLINGEPFVPGVYVLDPLAHEFEVHYDEANYGFEADNRLAITSNYVRYKPNDTVDIIINFGIYPLLHEGEFTMEDMSYFNAESGYIKNGPYKIFRIDTSTNAQNTVTITRLDTINNIVSGLFEFDLREIDDSTDVLEIREGRFDAVYQPW